MSEGEILILEDDGLIAMDIEMTLAGAGYKNLSVHSKTETALSRISESAPVAALLDFNLGKDMTSLPVAEALRDRGVPFIFLTGYTEAMVQFPDNLPDVPRIAKPFRDTELLVAVKNMVSQA